MKSAFLKDIWRTIRNTKKRFVCIALIVTLGVTMMCGLRAGCIDLKYSADRFFDEQNLFDIRILSTLGITEEDVEALGTLDIIEVAEGGFNETIYIEEDGLRRSIEVRTLSKQELNQPYVLEGRLPEYADEIVITQNYVNQSGKGLADRIRLEEEAEYLTSREYIITGIIIDSMDVNSSEGSMGFRSTATTDYVGYVLPEAVDSDIYTVLYLKVDGAEKLNCYTDEYEQKINSVVDLIEGEIKTQRENARYEEVYGEAMEEWLEGEQKMLEEFAKADAEIADAQAEITEGKRELNSARNEIVSGRQQLIDGEAELNRQEALAEQEFANAREEIESGYAQIEAGKQELAAAYEQLAAGQAELDDGMAQLKAIQSLLLSPIESAYESLAEQEAENNVLCAEKQQLVADLEQQIAQIQERMQDPEITEELKQQLASELAVCQADHVQAQTELSAAETEKSMLVSSREALDKQKAGIESLFADSWQQIEDGQAELNAGWEQYYAGVSELEDAQAQLDAGLLELERQEQSAKAQIEAGRQEIISGRKELKDAEAKVNSGWSELAEGEAVLAANLKEYEDEKAKAEKELADAREKIEEIDMTKWYVQDRFSLSGCNNVKSDAASIQALGDLFPILFLIVSILISLTTITRMVEEERGLIGTYKALGFSNGQIRRKYIIYAATATLIGGIIGDIGGYVIIPAILFIVFHVMYSIPTYVMQFDLLYGLGGILLFAVGILVATMIACQNELKKTPAELMRPKAPKAGTRVLLERIPFIWKRMSFLNKVTARNLFRYKKRLLMTVFGITGCTALLLCGFTIKDTVSELMPQQYHKVYRYDLMTVANDDEFDALKDIFDSDAEIKDYIPVRIESVEMNNDAGKKETVQLIVVPEGESLDSYIWLKDEEAKTYHLEDDEVYVTRNAMRILGYQAGDIITIQNLDLEEADVEVTQIVENYFGNMMYMTEKTYVALFGAFECNGTLANLSDKCEDHAVYADEISRQSGVLSSISTQQMEAEFDSSFALINMVVYLILVLAAILAFVVLFTLSNTNISERERELATIKVLGFYNKEVHLYVNKETIILTLLGILCGMPSGWFLGNALMSSLKFSSLEFYEILYPQSFFYAGGITIVFMFLVNMITDRILDKINMVEALKSVE